MPIYMSVTSEHDYKQEFIDRAEIIRQFLVDYYKKLNQVRVRRLDYTVDSFIKVTKEEMK